MWLSDSALAGLIEKVKSSEHSTYLPSVFDAVQSVTLKKLEEGFIPQEQDLHLYVDMLRQIRRRCFDHWLHTLQQGSAVVNLPSFVKTYAGRVVEGMAAGRPVASWRIPGRPKTDELFVSGNEILHYSAKSPAELAEQIRYLIDNPTMASRIAANARLKLSLHHTTETRVRQIMDWLILGCRPDYSGKSQQLGDIRGAEFNQTFCAKIAFDQLNKDYVVGTKAQEMIDGHLVQKYVAAKEFGKAIACLEPSSFYPEVKGMIAHLQIVAGNADAAANLLYQALADEPYNADYLIDAAELAFKRGAGSNAFLYLQMAKNYIANDSQRRRVEILAGELTRNDDNAIEVKPLIVEAIIKAENLAQRGELSQAIQLLLDQGIKVASADPRPYVALAEILIRAGRYQDALEVLPEMPPDVDTMLKQELMAVCHCGLGDDTVARQAALEAGERPRALVVLGTLTARQGDPVGAESLFHQAVAEDPSCGNGWLSLGMLQWGQGKHDEAFEAVKRSVTVEPLNQAAVQILGDMAERLDLQSTVLEILESAAQAYPDCRHLALHKAKILALCGKEAVALEACEQFLVRFGVDDGLLQLALKLRERAGLYDRLNEAGQQSISLCMIVKDEEACLARCLASVKPVVHELSIVDTGSGDRTVAIATVFGARVISFPWNGSFADARNHGLEQARGAWVLVLDGDEVISNQDHAAITTAVHSSAVGSRAFSVLTRNYTSMIHAQGWTANDGSYPTEERAEGWQPSTKVRLFPNDHRFRFRGEVHEMVEPALRKAGIAIQSAPFVVHHYGELDQDPVRQLDKKLRYFETGMQKLAQQPDNLAAISELAVQAGELGRFEEGIGLWDRVLEQYPNCVEALFNKGYCLMGLQRYAEALELSQRALLLEPDHKEAAFNYGTCELYVGDPQRALAVIKPVAAQHPEYPLLKSLLATLYLATDSITAGQKLVQKLLNDGYGINGYIQERVAMLKTLHRSDVADRIIHNRSGG